LLAKKNLLKIKNKHQLAGAYFLPTIDKLSPFLIRVQVTGEVVDS
jgi:hypothetical protein